MDISFSRLEVALMAGALIALPASGFLAGAVVASRAAPMDSERATIQEASGDVQAQWIAYGCGDDGATLITRQMPSLAECKEVRLASESASFERPSRR